MRRIHRKTLTCSIWIWIHTWMCSGKGRCHAQYGSS